MLVPVLQIKFTYMYLILQLNYTVLLKCAHDIVSFCCFKCVCCVYSTDPILPVSMTQHECMTPTVSPDMPGKSLITCSVTANAMSLSNHTFLHGDRYSHIIICII